MSDASEDLNRRAQSADVALLLEGTFPYVAGGVSSWVNQIINGFPELTFAIIFLGSRKQDYGAPKFRLPANVVHFEAHYLYDTEGKPPVKPLRGDAEMFDQVEKLHDYFQAPEKFAQQGAQALETVVGELQGRLDRSQFLYSERAWNYTTRQYQERCTDPSFVDYFWTVRTMHAPIWVLSDIVEGFIPCKCYHSVSTGYAGFLGALLKRRFGKPLILSEHGIYTKERRIDLYAARWIADNRSLLQRDATEAGYFRTAWIRFFEAIGRMCYDASDQIIALYEANRLRQIQDGANEARTFNIPNGIDVVRFGALRDKRPAATPKVCCLIGRVVPIKDIKTYIRAMRIVANRLPEAQAWIAGPEDESPEYARECHELAKGLGLEKNVLFLGFQQLTELLPKVGLVVLSSISEALPLVLLEGYAAGVPGVSTDVGSCRQLIHGLSEEDIALGASGAVVGIADPQALAEAIMEFFTDDAKWQAASRAGVERVNRYYTHPLMFARYREVYRRALAGERADQPGFERWAPL
ncbi:MAG: GT4 family glycosyltransferase PelF [Burkholderiaceae bacterium]|nr:GT4 family glycosyltransferase PelF [Burkholderiaceae bacterium]